MWLMLGVLSFVLAWMCWQMLDHYLAIQPSLSQLPYPPSVTDTLWSPLLHMLARVMILVVALSTATIMTSERSQKTLLYLLLSHRSTGSVVRQKLAASATLLWFVWLQVFLFWALLETGGTLSGWQVLSGVLGLSLAVLWMAALGLLIGVYCHATATAALLSIVVMAVLWLLGADGSGQAYGMNWLKLCSPAHHLDWLFSGELSISSVVYFAGGVVLFSMLTEQKLKQLRDGS